MSADENYKTVRLPDGRKLAYAEYGDPNGTPVMHFHGTPGSRIQGRVFDATGRQLGVRVIAIDRPGYGRSDPKKHRRIQDWPDDVAALADALGIEKFAVTGVSGGGPHVAACLSRIPHRLTAAALISSAGANAPGFVSRFGFAKRALYKASFAWTRLTARPFNWLLMQGVRLVPARYFTTLPDPNVLKRPGMKQQFRDEDLEAFRQGSRAAADELVLHTRPWGFALPHGEVQAYLWHGDADKIVPVEVGRYLASIIPGCVARFYPGEEHLMVVDHTEEILRAITTGMAPALAPQPAAERGAVPSRAAS